MNKYLNVIEAETVEVLQELNKDQKLRSVWDKEFKKYFLTKANER